MHREKGMKIFVWPKVIFLYPTAIVALICWAGMWINHDRTHDPTRSLKDAVKALADDAEIRLPSNPAARHGEDRSLQDAARRRHHCHAPPPTYEHKVDRFKSPQNLLAMLFLGMFAFNLLVMALDFPRFTLVAWILAVLFACFSFCGSVRISRWTCSSRSTRSSPVFIPSRIAAST